MNAQQAVSRSVITRSSLHPPGGSLSSQDTEGLRVESLSQHGLRGSRHELWCLDSSSQGRLHREHPPGRLVRVPVASSADHLIFIRQHFEAEGCGLGASPVTEHDDFLFHRTQLSKNPYPYAAFASPSSRGSTKRSWFHIRLQDPQCLVVVHRSVDRINVPDGCRCVRTLRSRRICRHG